MPTYDYRCIGCNRTAEVEKGMFEDVTVHCTWCGSRMNKIIGAPAINWGGLKPSDLENSRSPAVQSMIDNESENRAKYIEQKEKRNDRH